MKPHTIKLIDSWIGQPVCFLLTLWNKLIQFIRPFQNKAPQKILFIKLIEQGATVLAYSAIKEGIKMVGKENVYFCVFKKNRPILDIMAIIPEKNILSIREDNFFIFISDILKLLIKTRKLKIDTTIDMEFFSRASAILAYLSGAKYRVGLHRFTSEYPYRGDLMTHKVQYNPYLHTSKGYLLLVEALKHNPDETPLLKIPANELSVEIPRFIASDEEKQNVKKIILQELEQNYNVSKTDIPSPVILLNPNASDMLPLRKWQEDRFIELGKRISFSYPNALIIITGAPDERVAAEKICERIKSKENNSVPIISLAGKTTLRELFTLYTISDVIVTNDSGPGHFASMTDIKSIVLFGPETPELFGPMKGNIVWKKLACSPCVNVFNHRFSPCKNNICMQTISVDEVFKEVELVLTK